MKYGNKKKKMAVGGVGKVKKMRAGGRPGRPIGNPIRGGSDYMPKPPRLIGRPVPRKRPINPKVPMKMDAEGRRGMKGGGAVVSYQDYVKKTFG
tara:strand:- start:53 stop:334 length:282 start_codon:yes stop_codon:yes gene_type:complete